MLLRTGCCRRWPGEHGAGYLRATLFDLLWCSCAKPGMHTPGLVGQQPGRSTQSLLLRLQLVLVSSRTKVAWRLSTSSHFSLELTVTPKNLYSDTCWTGLAAVSSGIGDSLLIDPRTISFVFLELIFIRLSSDHSIRVFTTSCISDTISFTIDAA